MPTSHQQANRGETADGQLLRFCFSEAARPSISFHLTLDRPFISLVCFALLNAQAMLYATDGVDSGDDFNKAMVGVASVW